VRGERIVVADRFLRSSKTCSACGCDNPDVVLCVDVWTCIECGVVHECDPDGEINLEKLGLAEAESTRPDIASLPECLRIPASAAEPRTLMRRPCAHLGQQRVVTPPHTQATEAASVPAGHPRGGVLGDLSDTHGFLVEQGAH
jgi:hypothetical protein